MLNIWGGAQLTDIGRGNNIRPWMSDEYIRVDGFELVYTVLKGKESEITVHMPGGRRETPESLRKQGFIVVMPERLRTNKTV